MPKLKMREDKLKELLLGRKAIRNETNGSIADKCRMNEGQVRYFFTKESGEWELGTLLQISRCLGISIDEIRGAIRY